MTRSSNQDELQEMIARGAGLEPERSGAGGQSCSAGEAMRSGERTK